MMLDFQLYFESDKFLRHLRYTQTIYSFLGVLCSLVPLSMYKDAPFVLICLGCATFLRIGMLSMNQALVNKKNDSNYSWIKACNSGSFMMSVFGCLCMIMGLTGVTTISSYCQAFVSYMLSFLLILDGMICKSKNGYSNCVKCHVQ